MNHKLENHGLLQACVQSKDKGISLLVPPSRNKSLLWATLEAKRFQGIYNTMAVFLF